MRQGRMELWRFIEETIRANPDDVAMLARLFVALIAGIAIGLALVLVHLACIRYTGTSVNPARSFGPALFEGGAALNNLWIFIVGPFVGGALAAGVWRFIEPTENK